MVYGQIVSYNKDIDKLFPELWSKLIQIGWWELDRDFQPIDQDLTRNDRQMKQNKTKQKDENQKKRQ